MNSFASSNGQSVLQEEEIKKVLEDYLNRNGWKTEIAWGHNRGSDIVAVKGTDKWIIEVKGPGSRSAMQNNYFVSILGEILQRMEDCQTEYSIALPDISKYRRLWNEFPQLAKKRTKINLILVSSNGEIDILS